MFFPIQITWWHPRELFLSNFVRARASTCIKYAYAINEMSKGKFPDLEKQSIQAKKVYRHFFFFGVRYWNVERNLTHTQRKVKHDMERQQYI